MYIMYMSVASDKHISVNVADEVFLVVADLHRLRPNEGDFSVREIIDHARQMNLTGTLRTGFEIHVRQHSVANLPPNKAQFRTLFASGKARRRLLIPGDEVHPHRTGKIWPEPEAIPVQYRALLDWAKERFGELPLDVAPLSALLALRGSGRELWKDEHADQYVDRLRADWQ